MTVKPWRVVSIAAALVCLASMSRAQTVQWGVKGGVTRTSVNAVPDYYDTFLCCHPLFPGARVDATPSPGFTGGVFVGVPAGRWFSIQGEALLSRKRHAVDLQPFEPIQLTFARDYIEAAGLLKLELPATSEHRIYIAGGPVFGFRIGEHFDSSDPDVRRGDPETDVYVVQIAPYTAPELLRTSQTSLAFAGGWMFRRLIVEVRFTRGLQSMFKDREGIIAGFVKVGGHEPTLRRLAPQFAPFLESAKNRDVAVLAGFRF